VAEYWIIVIVICVAPPARAVIVWMKRYSPSDGTYSLAAPDGHLSPRKAPRNGRMGH